MGEINFYIWKVDVQWCERQSCKGELSKQLVMFEIISYLILIVFVSCAAVKAWDLTQLDLVQSLTPHSNKISVVLATPDCLITASDDSTIKVPTDFIDVCLKLQFNILLFACRFLTTILLSVL